MKSRFMPDYYFNTFDMVTPDFLLSKGIKGMILDVDNTLEPYENPTPGEHVVKWLSDLLKVGIRCAIVSNNDEDRIEIFNKDIGLPAFFKAGKPLTRNVKRAIEILKLTPSECAMMGDQIFTDVLAANSAGLLSILVPPINDKKNFITRLKRFFEKPIMKKYHKKKAQKTKEK